MTANSIAVQAIESLPATAAAPSFNGHGWLVVINLTAFTAGFYLMLMLAGWMWFELRKWHGQDGARDPVTVLRVVMATLAVGFGIICGAEAYALWAWDSADPVATATAQQTKRLIDPVGWVIVGLGFARFALSSRSLANQLRRKPREVITWPARKLLVRPALLVLIVFLGSIGVVSTR